MAKKFVPFGLERGSTGALGKWDVIGNALDSANPFASTDDGRDEDAKAAALQEDAFHAYDDLEAPDLQPVEYEDQAWLGDYAPVSEVQSQRIDPALMGRNAYDDIDVDPRLEQDQMASLDALRDIVNHGGRTAAEEAKLQHSLSDSAAADAGRRGAILQNMQARGMGGSGMELLAQLQSSQAATNQANQNALDINADAEQRALAAIQQQGALAGNIRSQDYGEQANRAAAQNTIDQFNAGTMNSTNQFNSAQAYDASKTNAGYANDAAKSSWEGRQANANANTGTHNKQVDTNTGIQQQGFENDANVTAAKAGAAKGYADYVAGVADRKAKANAGQKGAIMGTVGSVVGSMVSDERAKKDVREVRPEEIEEFLASLAPKHFRYRDARNGEGNRVGTMAQDIEATALGRDIVHEDGEGTKNLDTNNLLGAIVASLAHLNQKVK